MENYSVLPEVTAEILKWAGVTPDVNGFATKANRQFEPYRNAHNNAFDQDWSRDILWMNAPWSKMEDVVHRAVMDQAREIMVKRDGCRPVYHCICGTMIVPVCHVYTLYTLYILYTVYGLRAEYLWYMETVYL